MELEGSGRGIIKVLCRHLSGGTEENRENLTGVPIFIYGSTFFCWTLAAFSVS
jgi:hypothetical protein